ncbi:PucR family transcriptional regulator [Microbacterium rhizomatis]|uniref:PucR family transcriptional regulator n=2 Tax=Microbacterium rhizomatis TaxID=1631477 RepID=A0A5J5J5R3_9MICO|nr:PucR family transcriptional regulator [Microbacterium rhizomatis]
MCPRSEPDLVARTDLDATTQSDLYGLFRVGSKMFAQPTRQRTLRLAVASARAISGCTIPAVYVAAGDHLVRYSGRANRRLDSLVDAREGISGVLEHGKPWRYALFFRGTGKVQGAMVLDAGVEPSREVVFLLGALAEPTGAALATAGLIERERRQADELRQVGETQASSNRVLAATIVRLNSHGQIRDSLVAAAGASNGEAQIVEALSAITRRSVVLQDSFGNQRAFIGVGDSPAPSNLYALVTNLSAALLMLNAGWRSTRIQSGREMLGVIGIYDPDDVRSDDDRFAVDYASAMIAVELAHDRRVAEVEIRLGRDLADDLVTGADVVDALARAEALHFDLSRSQRVVLVSWEDLTPNHVDIGGALRRVLATMRVPALISRRPGIVLAVVADCDISNLYDMMSSTVSSPRGTIGVGGRCTTAELARSFAEATTALNVRVRSHPAYGLSSHDDLGLLRILNSSDGGVELGLYLDKWLGELVRHDRDHHSELVHTLTVYLDSGGNYDRTADGLMVHRSTLRYRLRRIREVTGRDLTDPDSRLNLHIAVRARAALGVSPL